MTDRAELKALHAALLDIVREAGACVMAVYATDFDVADKADASPVTEADRSADALIVARLKTLTPDIFIVSEESTEAGQRPADGAPFWLVDPLDGTKEFINRNGEFTVSRFWAWCWPLRWGGCSQASWARAPGLRMRAGGAKSAAGYRRPRVSPWWPAARTAMRPRWTPIWPAARWPMCATPARR